MFKIKLANRFNTIEWEVDELPTTDELNSVYKLLESVEITDSKSSPTEEEIVPLATDKQVEILTKMGYKNAPMMTKKEAWEIINKAYSK